MNVLPAFFEKEAGRFGYACPQDPYVPLAFLILKWADGFVELS